MYGPAANRFNPRNDIVPPRHLRQLNRLNFDYDSPRMKTALDNLGVSVDELQIR